MVVIHNDGNDSDYGTSGSDSDREDEGNDATPNNNNNNNDNFQTTSWRGWKERGRQAYIKGEYASALQAYSQALQRNLHDNNNNNNARTIDEYMTKSGPAKLDQQILLSNMVACRLKLGGAAQAEAAVATAQKCIAVDQQWAKGHFRLAEARIALGKASSDGGVDGDKAEECHALACEALRKVIDLDPLNQNARDLLTRELRRRAVGPESNRYGGSNPEETGVPEPSAPPEYMDVNRTNSSNNQESSESRRSNNDINNNNNNINNNNTNNNNINNNNNTFEDIDVEDDPNYDPTPTLQDHIGFQIQRAKAWYLGMSEDDQSFFKVAVVFVALYVAFGGRFGLEYLGKNNKPPRRSNAVYEEFYRTRNNEGYQSYHEPYFYGGRSRRSRHSSSWSDDGYSMYPQSSSDYSGGYWYIIIVVGLSYYAQSFFGVDLFNMLRRRANRRRFGRWGGRRWGDRGWGGRYNVYGRNHFRHRPRGMWG